MSEITLDRAIALLSSDKVKERSDGLADLKHILQQNKQNSELDALNDKACHKIFESLFQFISVERSAFKKANSNSSRSNAQPASRLSSCASVIRIAVDVLLRNLRTKSVRAIIDHVIDTLSAPDERLWEPLRVDYMKCLAILLQFPPHVEHLPVTQWERLMGFCLRSLGSQEDGDAVSSSQIVHRSSSGKFGTDSGRSTPSRNMPTPVATERFVGDESVLEEVLTHVQLLTASPNAPVNVMSERILHELVGYVKSSTSGNAQRVAFSTINTVVTRILFDQSELVRASMLDLIPVIRRLWNTKYIGLKDEMLSTITLCMSILADTAQREPSESLSSLLDSLVDTLYAEYTSRSEKDVFQLDDSIFHHSARQSIRNPVFGPRLGNTKSEHNWTVLWAIAVLIELSEKIAERLIAPQGSEEAMRKKQRLTSIAEDVFRDSFSSSGLKRTCSLQLIPFLIDSQIVVEARASLLERLIPNILDDNSTIASWTMVAIASFVCTHDAKSPSLKGHWQQVWDFTFRASTSQSISRVACHLMSAILDFQLLEYSVVAETTRSMLLSVNLSGPSTISDSSLALWATVTRLNTQMNPGSMLSASKRVCGWLREVWTIGTVTDKIQAAQVATFARPLELLNLLFACTNRPFVLAASRFRGPAGIIGKHWHFCLRNRKLMEYLFHVDNIFNCHDPWDTDDSLSLESSARADPNDNVVLNLLQAKAEAFLQAWQTLSHGESYHVSVDVVQILSSFCIVVFLFTECLPHQPNSASQNLRHHCKHLWVVICSYLAHHEVHFTNACLELICPIFSPAVCSTGSLGALSNGLYDIATPFVEILEQQRQLQKRHASSDHGEFMDLDGPMWTNKELVAERQSIMDLNREALSSFPNFAALRRCMTIQLSIFKIMTDASRSGGLDDVSLIDYLINLDHADILSAQSYLPHVYRSCSGMKRETILQILEDLGEKCLQSYEVERCESSLCLCIRMMSSFTDSWTINEGDGLSDSAADIYTWFMDVILTKRKASSGVYIALAGFLENVLMSNAAYLNDEFSPSPRTGLFTILRDGDVPVKFGVAESIPRIFGRFLLKDHDSVFDDILSNLPGDTDWKEGIALRLFVLARLASQWHTLLRRSIYHVFETPAQVPRSVEYAQKCLQTVSKTLGLHDAKELFRLFSSQIIFTWTEANSIDSIPFGVFGYTSLKELLIDVQDEVVGQIMMRGRDHETVQLTKHVNIPFVELLNTSLYKAAAYGIARDISIPPEPKSQSKSVESRLRKLFGSDVYLDRLEKQFPQTVATLFRSLGQYEQVERAFSRRPGFQHALGIMKHITSLSSSKSILPANQQPSFRARFFLDELDFLCKRTGYELETIWTPTLASYVCRVLLESIHPALGSLHACSVIRKLRVLVCVAGPVFLRDYPLEMLMHALRPFLTDIHCSEDALGIFWYLLEAGGPYLMENPRFLAEIAASTFVSLRILFASSPGGTTKDAQFEMVLTNARTFHQWFREFLNAYYGRRETHKKPREEARIEEYLRHLVISSMKMAAPGSAFRDDRESLLLMNILRTRHPERRMLSRSVSDLILSLYCVDFRRPLNYHHDVVREDGEALRICPAVWDSLQNPEVGIEYRLWAARVIGKDYAVTGTISDAVLKEQGPSMFGFKDSVSTSDIVQKSKARILQNLCDMLRSNNRLEVGLVERTLQLIVSKLDDYDESEDYSHVIPDSLMNALIWNPYLCPAVSVSTAETYLGQRPLDWNPKLPLADWARNIALFLSNAVPEDPVTGSLSQILRVIPGLAVQLLPYILHEVLLAEFEEDRDTRHTISEIYKDILREVDEDSIPHARLIIDCILYLRDQPRPGERTIVDRDEWLDIDYQEASSAANKCRMRKTSLLFLEIQVSRVNAGSRRSSFAKYDPPSDFLHNLFKNIDDPDFFYGIIQTPSLSSVMERLDYESTGIKNLLFHSAQYDSELQLSGNANSYGILKALNSTNLQGVASSVFSSPGASKDGSGSLDSMLQASMSLQQWDIPVSPVNPSPSAIVYRTLQGINTAGSIAEISPSVDESYTATLGLLASSNKTALSMKDAMRTLSTVTEIGDVLCSTSAKDVDEEWEKIVLRGVSSRDGSSRDIGEALNVREALFSSIKRKDYLKSAFRLSDRDAQLLEVKVIRKSLGITRAHEMSQASLKSAIRLTNLVQPCASLGINIDGAAKYDLANVLWDQGEMTTSIQILQQLNNQNGLSRQSIPINRAELLVTLGHHVAEARLEKPEAIIQQYLSPAVKDLRGRSEGVDASRVFHGFAMFCDQQFQNQDGLEDFKRVEQLRNCKLEELRAFEAVLASAGGSERNRLKMDRARTKQWFELDDREYQRLRRIRDDFLEQCLGNYLLSLQASDRYNNDALRFCAIWFDESDSLTANMAVSKHLDSVPSRKFAPLMNQLSSRLLDDDEDPFQSSLSSLIYRICVEHPFHGMYQVFASSKSRAGREGTSLSRYRAAGKLSEKLKSDTRQGGTWFAIHNANISYVRFAVDQLDEGLRSGSKVPLSRIPTGLRLQNEESVKRIPPPTMEVKLRHDCDYSRVPTLASFLPECRIASGISAPKIVTAVASDGVLYKQLFKGGNDDLRQDAIMEQVFDQVSNLLKEHRATRQRNLGIRTYKVLPLTSNAGIIEFVQNTIPLHDYLLPAHQRYYPNDMKPNDCRKLIADVQKRSFDQRVRTFRQVMEHFHPVMRYFFMENYSSPDDWFSKRLSYTRSTAAISILGHILGLGDRHGHNILLDQNTGEVVHIDLGVAFEQGRILPIPEVVPFRLTRDLVDGMGITKTEGVFRRCCEFTLEALRQESYSIMTILDVLRYDPLYSWTVSPLRMKKMQDNPEAANGPPLLPGATRKTNADEPSEADRALTVVAKKLSKSLSVTATVNELIQQATDERNLAVLYCGWASYF